MDFQLMALMGALVYAFLNFVKYARSKDWNGVITQAAGWAAGIAVVFLASATDFASNQLINDVPLNDLNSASKILLGLMATSLFTFGHDIKKAIDRSDSAVMPALLTGKVDTHGATPDVVVTHPETVHIETEAVADAEGQVVHTPVGDMKVK